MVVYNRRTWFRRTPRIEDRASGRGRQRGMQRGSAASPASLLNAPNTFGSRAFAIVRQPGSHSNDRHLRPIALRPCFSTGLPFRNQVLTNATEVERPAYDRRKLKYRIYCV